MCFFHNKSAVCLFLIFGGKSYSTFRHCKNDKFSCNSYCLGGFDRLQYITIFLYDILGYLSISIVIKMVNFYSVFSDNKEILVHCLKFRTIPLHCFLISTKTFVSFPLHLKNNFV